MSGNSDDDRLPVFDSFEEMGEESRRQFRQQSSRTDVPVASPVSWPTISIFCDEHETPYLVEHFVKVDDEWTCEMQSPAGTRDLPADPRTGRVKSMRSASTDAFGFIDSEGKWSRDIEGTALPGWTNAKSSLRCQLCSKLSRKDRDWKAMNVPAPRHKLVPILDLLAKHGKSEILLSQIAARL